MNVLTEEDRKSLVKFLYDNASDQVLVTAVADCKAERENTRNQFSSLQRYIGNSVEKRQETPSPAATTPAQQSVSETQDPPGEACSRIGANTRANLLAMCKTPKKPEEIGRSYFPHLRLLWERGELAWDGSRYLSK